MISEFMQKFVLPDIQQSFSPSDGLHIGFNQTVIQVLQQF